MSTESERCPVCGTPASAWLDGNCPNCLMRLGGPADGTEGQAEGATEAAQTVLAEPQLDLAGRRIGRYKLLERIGEGGFGEVYMAEQIEPVQRKVAFKIIKAGMDSRQIIARFEAERQALALMDHPNIAKVLDAGTTETGRPYFVMELVRGISITRFCDQKRLSTTDRLKLFIDVCHAVQHAHQKGIIHRDIKPSNVLVTLHDGKAVPKVIDFGIAKALAQKLTDKTLFTGFAQLMGTPAYMSPEQAELSGLDIDTRSDIYSLGVLLYELLTGVTPFDKETMAKAALDEIRRMIRETDPPRPSTRVETLGAKATEIAKDRQTEPEALRKLVRGDLDWIVMKCLEKDRTRRYETTNGLARDIQRHLENEPVVARPPSNAYRFQKLVRRNKLAFAAAGMVAAALIIGLIVSVYGLGKAERQRRRAEASEKKAQAEAAKSEQVARFLQDMLVSVGPSVAQGRDTALLREVLDRTAERIGTDLKGQPLVEAELRTTLGEVYRALGEYQSDVAMQREALALRRNLLGNENPSVAASLDYLARALWKDKKLAESESTQREALAMRRSLFGSKNLEVALSLNYLGRVLTLEHKYDQAESAHHEALAIRKELLGEKDPKVAESLKELANVLSKEHKTAEADAVLSQALEIDPKSSLGVQANILQQQGKLSEAEAVLRKRLETQNSLGTNHPDVALSLGNLSRTYRDMGQLTKSIVAAEKALQATKSKVGEAQPQTVVALGDLAELYGQAGRSKDVAAIENEVRKIGDLKGANFPAAMRGIGRGYRDCGLYADSLRVFLGVADKGDSFCTSEVGWAYEQGLAVPKDLAEAAKWYRKAAELGNEWSWQRLAVMYDKGQGVPKDPVEAAICYTRDAELGNASSQVALAQIYQHGQGVETNLPEAVKWYRKAADSDNVTALAALLRMSQRGEIAAVNSVEFEKRLEKAADRGDIRTKYDLGRLYERDDGLPNDPAKAAKWYRSVIESGNASELNDIAWSLATSARTEGRDGRNAIAFAQKAVEATGRNEPNYVDTLAAAYAEAGDFQKAVAIQEEAIALLKDEAAKKDFSSRLKVYESGMPYHEGP